MSLLIKHGDHEGQIWADIYQYYDIHDIVSRQPARAYSRCVNTDTSGKILPNLAVVYPT